MPDKTPCVNQRHNPDCTRNGCRACLGYGVLLTGHGPSYRRCDGEEAEGWQLADDMARLGTDIDAMPRWSRRRRHALREWRRLVRRYREVVMDAR